MKQMKDIVNQRGIPWTSIFPYDLQDVRNDWVRWIKDIDFPCVYSKYGYNLLKDIVPKIRYFRPPLQGAGLWRCFDEKERKSARQSFFSVVGEDEFIFGFVGANQIRKDPLLAVKAFSVIKKKTKRDVRLYMHVNNLADRYNIKQYASDCGLSSGDLLVKQPSMSPSLMRMVSLYNSLDCLVNCSLQEGLSWTLVEAMLCGLPFIASRTTSQIELLEDAGYGIPCEIPTYMPLFGKHGPTWLDAKRCKLEDLVGAMEEILESEELRKDLKARGLKAGKQWLAGVSDINKLLEEVTAPKEQVIASKEPAVLFAQHSAAGDVFMTTRCFKGLKERYGLPIHYMTSKQYTDILRNNPYIDKILEWDEGHLNNYRAVVNPHGERILPGHWGRNSNSLLSDFYWKILEVEPDDFYIELKRPKNINESGMPVDEFIEGSWKPLAVLHTTGGDPVFRTYKYMGDVAKAIKEKYTTIQVGGTNDFPAWCDIDLRGKTNFRETAWVMSHASIAVTVDSFVSHLAGALGVPQVCLFGSGNHFVVRPNQVKGKLICLVPDYVRHCPGLGPCSGQVKDCPVKCTGRHSPKDIINAIEEIEREEEGYEDIGSRLQSVQ
jgi:glycosyltransferase involved in cell wall biosynthesis